LFIWLIARERRKDRVKYLKGSNFVAHALVVFPQRCTIERSFKNMTLF
jgi:hypothetical protein